MASLNRSSSTKYFPYESNYVTPEARAAEEKVRIAKQEKFIAARGGWVTSIAGARRIAFDVLPESDLPSELSAAGFYVESEGQGQRIVPAGIVENFVRSGGGLALATPGSTMPIAETRTHAGIERVLKFSFMMD